MANDKHTLNFIDSMFEKHQHLSICLFALLTYM